MGKLYVDGEYYCDTLEPPVSTDMHPAIQPGTYEVQMFPSKRFRALRPILIGVKGRSGILIHEGNTVRSTKGCILLGTWDGRSKVVNSLARVGQLTHFIKNRLSRGYKVVIEVVAAGI